MYLDHPWKSILYIYFITVLVSICALVRSFVRSSLCYRSFVRLLIFFFRPIELLLLFVRIVLYLFLKSIPHRAVGVSLFWCCLWFRLIFYVPCKLWYFYSTPLLSFCGSAARILVRILPCCHPWRSYVSVVLDLQLETLRDCHGTCSCFANELCVALYCIDLILTLISCASLYWRYCTLRRFISYRFDTHAGCNTKD